MPARAVLVAAVAVLAALAGAGTSSRAAPDGRHLADKARFACYPAQFGPFKRRPRRVVDGFGAQLSVSIELPDSVCAAAPGKATEYLTCYRTRLSSTTLRSTFVRGSDEFGRLGARVYADGLTLCAPAARADKSVLPPGGGRDLFTCYPLRVASSLDRGVSVLDDFGSQGDTVLARTAVCAAAAEVGSRIVDRRHYLTCYAVRSNVKGSTVIMRDRFGLLKAALGVRSQLCTAMTR